VTAFRFRAAPLLEWRQKADERARLLLSRAEAAARAEAARAAEADARLEGARSSYREALATTVDASDLDAHRHWIARHEREAERARQSSESARRALDEAAQAAALARRQLRVVERLRDRALRRHLDAERRLELKEIDHLATVQYARRITEGGPNREY